MIGCSYALFLAAHALCSAVAEASWGDPGPQFMPAVSLAVDLPNVTASGYLPLSDSKTEDLLFYAYYEAQEPDGKDAPILLWLEVHKQAAFLLRCRVDQSVAVGC